jgi:hypothetical protein
MSEPETGHESSLRVTVFCGNPGDCMSAEAPSDTSFMYPVGPFKTRFEIVAVEGAGAPAYWTDTAPDPRSKLADATGVKAI